jgi:hypothetical protein
MPEPPVAERHVADLVAQDDVEHADRRLVADAPEPGHDGRRGVQPPRLQHPRHQRHSGERVVGGLHRHVPQPAMGRKIAVAVAQRGQPLAHQPEVIGLFRRHLQPPAVEIRRQIAEAIDAMRSMFSLKSP